jgi:hypothetical protein
MERNLTVIHPNDLIQISHRLLAKHSDRLTRNPVLDPFPRTLKFQASITDLQQFVPALEAKTVQTPHDNFHDLSVRRRESMSKAIAGSLPN